jgi:very-short-patch-repair endonuclease
MKNTILPYNPKLRELAKKLRKQGVLSEAVFWKKVKNKAFGIEFYRQVPIDNFIVDFYCHELMLAIEIDGNTHDFIDVQISDLIRQNKLENLGIKFLRFTNSEVLLKMDDVIFVLENKIHELKNIPLDPP